MLMKSEPEIHDSFADNHFFLDGYSAPYRLDLNRNGRSALAFVRNTSYKPEAYLNPSLTSMMEHFSLLAVDYFHGKTLS